MNAKLSLLAALLGAVAVVAAVVLLASIYTVDPTEQVIITQFGEPQGEPIQQAGLHFKVPFIQRVNRIPKHILSWGGQASEMPTKDKLYIRVDTFGRWRVTDPLEYFRRMRDEPVRASVAAIFSTPAAEEAFLPEPAADAEPRAGADVQRHRVGRAARGQKGAVASRRGAGVDLEADRRDHVIRGQGRDLAFPHLHRHAGDCRGDGGDQDRVHHQRGQPLRGPHRLGYGLPFLARDLLQHPLSNDVLPILQDNWGATRPFVILTVNPGAGDAFNVTARYPSLLMQVAMSGADDRRIRKLTELTAAAFDPIWTDEDRVLFTSFEHLRFSIRTLSDADSLLANPRGETGVDLFLANGWNVTATLFGRLEDDAVIEAADLGDRAAADAGALAHAHAARRASG